MNTAAGTFNVTTQAAGSTVAVTGLGFTPTLVLLVWSYRTEATDAAGGSHFHLGWGAMAGPADRGSVTGFSTDGAASGNPRYWLHDAACIVELDAAGPVGAADFSSFDADGFTVVIDDQFATDLRVSYLAMDTVSVDIGTFQVPPSTGTQQIATSVDPELLITGSTYADSAPPSGFKNGCVSLGVATSPAEEWSSWVSSRFNADPMETYHYFVEGECVIGSNAVDPIRDRAELSSFDAGGFTLNWLEVHGAAQNYSLYVAVNGGGASFQAGTLLTRTDGADIPVTGVGFTPDGLFFSSCCHAQNVPDTPRSDAEITVGVATSPTSRSAQGASDQDALATSEGSTMIEHDAVYVNPDLADGVEGRMDLKSLDGDGFTTVMDTPDPAQAIAGYLAFGEAPTAPRRARVSAFETEVPTAPRRARVSAFETETPDGARTARVSAYELETEDAPRAAQVSAFEVEAPTAPRRARVSAYETEVPGVDRKARVSAFETEVPNAPGDRSARVSAFETEVPTAPRKARVSAFEQEVVDAPRRARVSAFETEVPTAPRRARVSAFEAEIPTAPRRARVSAFEQEVAFAPRSARVSAFNLEILDITTTGISYPAALSPVYPLAYPVADRIRNSETD